MRITEKMKKAESRQRKNCLWIKNSTNKMTEIKNCGLLDVGVK